MNVTLGLTTATTMGMVLRVHGHTANRRANAQPPSTTGFTELSILMVGIAGNPDRRTAVLVNQPHFTTLEPNRHMIGKTLHSLPLPKRKRLFLLGALSGWTFERLLVFLIPLLVGALGNDSGKGPSAAAEHAALSRPQTDIEDHSAYGDHVQRQAVPPPSGSRRKNTWVDGPAHALQQVIGNAGHVALNHVSGPQPVGRENVAQLLGFHVPNEGDVRGAIRVVLNPFHDMRTRGASGEINDSNAPLMTTATVPNGHPTGVVAATLPMTLFGERQFVDWPPFPQVVINRSSQMSNTGRSRLIFSDQGAGVALGRWWCECDGRFGG